MAAPWEKYQGTPEDTAGPWNKYQGTVNRPTTLGAAVAVRNDLPPPVEQKYNPNQSTLGYAANEVGKSLTGLFGMPEALIRRLAEAPTPFQPMARLAVEANRAAGNAIGVQPNMATIGRVAQIDPSMKAPGPGTEFLTGLGIEIGQNFLFPGGGPAEKIASGVGSFIGREVGKDAGPAGEFAGSFFGGMAGPALVATRLGAAKTVLDAVRGRPNFIEELKNNPQVMAKVRQDVLNELSESLRQDPGTYAAKFKQAQELETAIPGLKLNLGQSFLAPSVLQKQRALETSSPIEMNAAQARRNANESVLRTTLGANPNSRAGAEGAITEVAESGAARSRDIAAQIAKTSDEATAIAARVQTADLPALGQRALDIRNSELGTARQKANSLMDLASTAAKQEGASFDVAPLVVKARQIQAEPIWDDANTTAVFGKIKGLSSAQDGGFDWNPVAGATPRAAEGGTIGFDDLREMRQAVNADISAALRSTSPNARAQLRNLEQMKAEIDSVIAKSPFEATKKAYGDFVTYYRTEFAPRFLRGVNLMSEKRTSLGESRLPPEQVFKQYFKPNGGIEMGRYLKLYGENPEAMVAMRDAITDRYAREVIKDGAINPTAHARFMDRYKVPLAALDKGGFKFGAELQDTAKSFQAVTDRLASLQDAASRSDKDLVRGIISDSFGAKQPELVIEEIMSDPRKTNLLLSRMNDKQARGLVDFMKDDIVRQFSKDGQIQPEAIDAFLSDRMRSMSYRNALAKVYGTQAADSQLDTLRQIGEAARRLDATPVPQAAATQGRPSLFNDDLRRRTGLSIAVIGNMTRAVIAGRVSPEWAALALGSQAGATVMQNMRNAVYEEVLKDPESSKLLLRMMTSSPDSGAGMAAATAFMKKAPKVLSYFLGFNKYPDFAKYVAANYAREESEKSAFEPQTQE